MNIIGKIKRIVLDKKYRFQYRLCKGHFDSLTDEAYLKKIYKLYVGRKLNLESPATYTEKLQWLKLHDRQPIYTVMQDKYLVREFIAKTIGEEYLIPLLGVWEDPKEIDFDSLPNQFVLKCNHDCASVIICRDKSELDRDAAIEKLKECLRRNYWIGGREWAYKGIPPKVIAEQYLQDGSSETLTDYKFFCCNGKAKMLLLASGTAHTKERRLDYYDTDFHRLPIVRGSIANSQIDNKKPEQLDLLISLAEKIASGIPFIRVDFYLIQGKPYFGEVAFYPSSGLAEFHPIEWEKRVGSWIDISQVEN